MNVRPSIVVLRTIAIVLFSIAGASESICGADTLPAFRQTSSQYTTISEGPDGLIFITILDDTYSHDDGSLYQCSPFTGLLEELIDFNDSNGSYPDGPIAFIPGSRIIYGVTRNGGEFGRGTIYSYDLDKRKHTICYDVPPFSPFAHPREGFLVINDHTLMGVCGKKSGQFVWFMDEGDKGNLFTFDIHTNQPKHIVPDRPQIGTVNALPTLTANNSVLFISTHVDDNRKLLINEYDFVTDSITCSSSLPDGFRPNSPFVKCGDGNYYATNYVMYMREDSYLFLRYSSADSTCTKLAVGTPMVTMYGSRCTTDKDGNIIAYNTMHPSDKVHGYFYRYDIRTDSIYYDVLWKKGMAGASPAGNLLVHSNGYIYAVGEDGIKPGEGLFYSMDPSTFQTKPIARFIH